MANEDKVGCHELCWNPGQSRCMVVASREWFPIQKLPKTIQKKTLQVVLEHLKIPLEVSKEFQMLILLQTWQTPVGEQYEDQALPRADVETSHYWPI